MNLLGRRTAHAFAPTPSIDGLPCDLTDGVLYMLTVADVVWLRLLSTSWRDWIASHEAYWRRACDSRIYRRVQIERHLALAPRVVQEELGFALDLWNAEHGRDALPDGTRRLRFKYPVATKDEAALIGFLDTFVPEPGLNIFLLGVELLDVRPELFDDSRLLNIVAAFHDTPWALTRMPPQWTLSVIPPPAFMSLPVELTFCKATVTLEAARFFAANRGRSNVLGFKDVELEAGALQHFAPFFQNRLELSRMTLGTELLREIAACATSVTFRRCVYTITRAQVELALAPLRECKMRSQHWCMCDEDE